MSAFDLIVLRRGRVERFDAVPIPKSEFQQSLLDEQSEMEALRQTAVSHARAGAYQQEAAAADTNEEAGVENEASSPDVHTMLPDFHLDGNVQYFADYWQVRFSSWL